MCLTFSSSSPPLQSLGFPSCLGTIAAFFLTPTFQFNLSGSVTSWCCWPQLWQEGRMKRERRVSNLAFSCGSCVIEHTHLHKHSHAKPSYSCESVITGPFVYHETWNMREKQWGQWVGRWWHHMWLVDKFSKLFSAFSLLLTNLLEYIYIYIYRSYTKIRILRKKKSSRPSIKHS